MKYPDLEGTSLDILFISGIDMYNDFVEKEYLTSLNDELANGSKILNKYIYDLAACDPHGPDSFFHPSRARAEGK